MGQPVKTDVPGYVKDNGAVINTNEHELHVLMAERRRLAQNARIDNRVASLEQNVKTLCDDFSEIKQMLQQVLSNRVGH